MWNANNYERNAGYVSDLGHEALRLLNPLKGEKILDLGCGTGVLAKQMSESGVSVLCADSSPDMIRNASDKGLPTMLVDGHRLDFRETFDAVFSNAALHWMTKPDEVISKVYRALKPGGRFVAEFGGEGNVGTITSALKRALGDRNLDYADYNPWYFPSRGDYRRKLEKQGFTVAEITLFDRPTRLPTDVTEWLKTFAFPFMVDIPKSDQNGFLAEVADIARDALKKEDGTWYADYVRLRFAAVKNIPA